MLPVGHETKRFQLPSHLGRQLSREPLGGGATVELERLILLAAGAIATLGIRTVGPAERLVVFRGGRYTADIRRPGTTWIIPFYEKTARIKLEDHVPNWRSLEEIEIWEAIEHLLRQSGHPIAE